MAGAVFVWRSWSKNSSTRTAIAALAPVLDGDRRASSSFLATRSEFSTCPPLDSSRAATRPMFFILGVVCGDVAVAYNWVVLRRWLQWTSCADADRDCAAATGARRRDGVVRARMSAAVTLTQTAVSGAQNIFILPYLLLLRFWVGALSYAAGTPGGLFAPMLALGAHWGCSMASVVVWLPGLQIQPQAFAVVGMTALFAGVVRAPLTGSCW